MCEGTVNIWNVPSINVSLRECVGKHHHLVAKDIKYAIAKHRAEIIYVLAESNINRATLSAIILYIFLFLFRHQLM